MSTQVNIPTPFGVSLSTQSMKLLNANAARKFLSVQNKSTAGAQVTIKFDNDFIAAKSGVQTLTFDQVPTAGVMTLTYGPDTTPNLAYTAAASDIQTAMQALPGIGSGNCLVTGTFAAGFVFTFAGALALLPTTPITVSSSTLTNNAAQTSCTQVLSFSTVPTAGQYQLVDALGNISTALSFNSTPLDLAAALNALPAINGGVSNVTQDAGSKAFTIYFAGAFTANTDVPLLGYLNRALVSNVAQASAIQVAYAEPAPLQGTYCLMVGNGETTAPLAYNAAAAAVQAALELLPSIGAGNVVVTGASLVAGFTLTFGAALANTFIAPIYFINTSTMHPDILVPIQKRVPGAIKFMVNVTVPGHGTDVVTATSAFLTRGVAPRAVVTTVTINVVGNAKPIEGITINAGDSETYEVAVPVGGMWAVASVDSTPVEVWEG